MTFKAVLDPVLDTLAAREHDLHARAEQTQRAIDYFVSGTSSLYSPLAAEAFAAQAGVLRRQGLQVNAIGRLEQALTLLDERDAYAQKVRCRILDHLGLAHQEVGDLEAARRDFEAALESRRASGHGPDVCQSLVNLARLEVRAGDLEIAATYADEVITKLRGTPPDGTARQRQHTGRTGASPARQTRRRHRTPSRHCDCRRTR